jgi:hypothetical protein
MEYTGEIRKILKEKRTDINNLPIIKNARVKNIKFGIDSILSLIKKPLTMEEFYKNKKVFSHIKDYGEYWEYRKEIKGYNTGIKDVVEMYKLHLTNKSR